MRTPAAGCRVRTAAPSAERCGAGYAVRNDPPGCGITAHTEHRLDAVTQYLRYLGGDDTPTGVGDDGELPRRCGIDRGAGISAQPGAGRICWSRRDNGLRTVAGAGECRSGVVPDPRMQAGAADEQNRGRRVPTLRGDGGAVGRRCGICWYVS